MPEDGDDGVEPREERRELAIRGVEAGLVVESDRFRTLGVVERDTSAEREWLTATPSATMSADGASGEALVGMFGDESLLLDEPELDLPRPEVDHLVVPDSFDETATERAAEAVGAADVTRVEAGERVNVTLDSERGVIVTEPNDLVVRGTEEGLLVRNDQFGGSKVVPERLRTADSTDEELAEELTEAFDEAPDGPVVETTSEITEVDEAAVGVVAEPDEIELVSSMVSGSAEVDHLFVPDSFDEETVERAEAVSTAVTRVGEGDVYDVELDSERGVDVGGRRNEEAEERDGRSH